jgi:SAM-dependent methyltransferase
MAAKSSGGQPTFKELEQAGWDRNAPTYHEYGGQITQQGIQPMLDAVNAGVGTRLLETACGPGYGAGKAAARGAHAVGIDIAESMVVEARQRYPQAEFRQGDAEALIFDDASFDAVICPFGLLHMPEPDKAIAEAFRILKSGGRFAITVWCAADKHEMYALALSAIQKHGTMEVSLPPGPPFFRFSDPEECDRTLNAAGFVDSQVTELPLVHRVTSPQDILDLLHRSTVRFSMLVELQTNEARHGIHQAIIDGAEAHKVGEQYEMKWPAVMAAARKP